MANSEMETPILLVANRMTLEGLTRILETTDYTSVGVDSLNKLEKFLEKNTPFGLAIVTNKIQLRGEGPLAVYLIRKKVPRCGIISLSVGSMKPFGDVHLEMDFDRETLLTTISQLRTRFPRT